LAHCLDRLLRDGAWQTVSATVSVRAARRRYPARQSRKFSGREARSSVGQSPASERQVIDDGQLSGFQRRSSGWMEDTSASSGDCVGQSSEPAGKIAGGIVDVSARGHLEEMLHGGLWEAFTRLCEARRGDRSTGPTVQARRGSCYEPSGRGCGGVGRLGQMNNRSGHPSDKNCWAATL